MKNNLFIPTAALYTLVCLVSAQDVNLNDIREKFGIKDDTSLYLVNSKDPTSIPSDISNKQLVEFKSHDGQLIIIVSGGMARLLVPNYGAANGKISFNFAEFAGTGDTTIHGIIEEKFGHDDGIAIVAVRMLDRFSKDNDR